MGKMRKEKTKEWGNIWNPKNLQKEVHMFGYDFQWKTYLLSLVCMLLLLVAVGVFYRLEISYAAIVLVVALLLLPLLIFDMYKRMYEQKRFADVLDYMEQVLYSFRKEGKVLRALKECEQAMPDGMMKQSVGEAVRYLEEGNAQTEKGLLSEALHLIEERYECEKIHTVHELLISAEERGGEVENSIELLLEDIEVWKRQVYHLQSDKKKSHIDCILSIVMAVFMCGLDMYIMNMVKDMAYAKEDINVFKLTSVQMSSFLFLLMCLYTFFKSSKRLTADWLMRDKSMDASVIKAYRYVQQYDEKREQGKSILMALPVLMIAGLSYIWVSKIGSVICVLLAAFLMMQHKFSYYMNKKEVKGALYQVFPQWMMDMALLLQSNNVQVAIAQSVQKAPELLQKELLELLERIRLNPDDVLSYTAFCQEFDVPEIASSMKMLYSISESGSGNAQVQITNLVHHVHKLQEKEMRLKNEDINFKMRMICFYPVAATSVKMLVDMMSGTVLVFTLFTQAV